MSDPRRRVLPWTLALVVGANGCAPLNLPFPTLGGRQLWADERVDCGWRIQRHAWTGHHRLLSPRDVRWAWGDYARCEAALTAELAAAALEPRSSHAVVLLHGMIRSRASLSAIERRLSAEGYEVLSVGYPSTAGTVSEHAAQLSRVLQRARGVERVSFVTHSLGALVLRTCLAEAEAPWREGLAVERAVMLFPPNQGAHLAERWGDTWIYRLGGPCGQTLRPREAREVPPPSVPFVVLAGGRGDGEGRNPRIPGDDDGTVAVSEAYYPGAEAFEVLDAGHTFGMNDPGVLEAIASHLGR
ncbi:MAG: hypothetical protein R3F62_17565 [Planctomycetota bacterium]